MTQKNIKHLTLLHSNDMHGDFLAEEIDNELVGGVSLLSGYVNQVRRDNPNTLYMIAGDMFRGSLIDTEFKGISTIEIMNVLGPDIVSLGNHELDYGIAHLLFWSADAIPHRKCKYLHQANRYAFVPVPQNPSSGWYENPCYGPFDGRHYEQGKIRHAPWNLCGFDRCSQGSGYYLQQL